MYDVLTIFLLLGIIALAAMVFAVWLFVSVVRLIGRGLAALVSDGQPPVRRFGAVHCPRRGCGAVNPQTARFCRRCGQLLPEAPAARRRAAMW